MEELSAESVVAMVVSRDAVSDFESEDEEDEDESSLAQVSVGASVLASLVFSSFSRDSKYASSLKSKTKRKLIYLQIVLTDAFFFFLIQIHFNTW